MATIPTQSFLRRYRAAFLPLLLACAGIWNAWSIGVKTGGIDFYQFWIGGQVAHRPSTTFFYSMESRKALAAEFLQRAYAREHSDAMLVVAQARPSLELFSTPLLYTAFGVFGGRYDRDLLIFRIASLIAYVTALLLLAALAGFRPATSLTMIALILFLFAPLQSDIRVANVTWVQLLLLALWLWRTTTARQPLDAILAGAILAIAILFKPNIMLIAPFVVFLRVTAKEYLRLRRETIGFLLGTIVSVVGSSVFFRSYRVWLDWLAAAGSLARERFALSDGNVAPALLLIDSFGHKAAWFLLAIVGSLALVAIHRRRMEAVPVDLTALVAGLSLVVSLLTAPLVWMHYLVLALPLAYVLMGPRFDRVPRGVGVRQIAAAVALSLIAALPWEALLRVTSAEGEALLFWIGLVALLALALAQLLERRSMSRLERVRTIR